MSEYLGISFCNTLQRLETRAARIITKNEYEVRSVNLLNKVGPPNLEERRNHRLNALTHKVRHEMALFFAEYASKTKPGP